MALRIELDERGRDLLIRFDYDKRLVEAVRQLPGRRFDPRAKLWLVPVKHVDAVVLALLPHGFTLAPEVSGIARPVDAALPFAAPTPTPIDRATRDERAPTNDTRPPPTAFTVAGLNHRVRDALRGAFPDSVWVIGEVIDFDKSAGRRHRFFSLIDKAPDEARPLAQVEAALFESKIEELADKLAAAQPPLALRDGLEIRVRGRVDMFPQSGRYQLVIDDIDPAHTLGKLALSREQLLRELRSKGLDGKNVARPLPCPTLRLAVLASPTSDGWHDFLHQLEASGLAFTLTLYPVRVQGVELRRTVLSGLAQAAATAADHDALCILRGGGSRSDLSGFDDRELAYAVANHPLKILIGIGHERDRTVLDHIAQSFKTPTAIAAFLVEQGMLEVAALAARARLLADATRDLLDAQHLHLQQRAESLQTTLSSHLLAQRHVLALAAQQLRHGALSRCVATERHRAALANERLRRGARTLVRDAIAATTRAGARVRGLTLRAIERAQGSLAAHDLRCRLLDPRATLRRGYTMVRRASDGRIATDAKNIDELADLDIEFRDGVVRASVTTVTIRPSSPVP